MINQTMAGQENGDAVPGVTIQVGGLYASRTPVRISTVLGSCVSACLYDPSTRIGGMNHFLLPGDPDGSDLSTRYGINSMEVLINEMMKLGADRFQLKAKVFGGADIFRANLMMRVGERNIEFIRGFLGTEKIPVIKERVGGHAGLIVHFVAHTFEVFVKPISSLRFRHKEEEEMTYYKKVARELAERESTNVTLF